MSFSDLNEDEGVLKRQMMELDNQIHHLIRSNAEMKEVLETEGPDPDLRGAIGENIVAIARHAHISLPAYPARRAYSPLSTPRARRKAILEDLQNKFPNVHQAAVAAPTGVVCEPGISL